MWRYARFSHQRFDLNGHSDIVAGIVIGRADLVEQVTHKLNHLGGSLDPHACFFTPSGDENVGGEDAPPERKRFENRQVPGKPSGRAISELSRP